MDTGHEELGNKARWDQVWFVPGSRVVLSTAAETAEQPLLNPMSCTGSLKAASSETFGVTLTDEGLVDGLSPNLTVKVVSSKGPTWFDTSVVRRAGREVVLAAPEHVLVMQRREVYRVPVVCPVTVEVHGSVWVTHTTDCSVGGMRIALPCAVQIGDRISVILQRKEDPLRLSTEVRHVLRAGGMSLVGLEYLKLSSRDEREVAAFMGQCQRRLVPKMTLHASVDYKPLGFEMEPSTGLGVSISPGDVCFGVSAPCDLGERMEVMWAQQNEVFRLPGSVVNVTFENSGRIVVQVCFDPLPDGLQNRLEIAVSDLQPVGGTLGR